MKVCSVCGKQWQDTTRFCPLDGTLLAEAPIEISKTVPLPKHLAQVVPPAAIPSTSLPPAASAPPATVVPVSNSVSAQVSSPSPVSVSVTPTPPAPEPETLPTDPPPAPVTPEIHSPTERISRVSNKSNRELRDKSGSHHIPDPLSNLIGLVLNRTYKIEEKLGQGGMGAVFRARHLGIGDMVAIKVISPEHTLNSDSLTRFRREAQAARRLAHPNAVAVHDFNVTEEGLLFMVMEYVHGETVEKYLQQNAPLSPQRALEILRPVSSALDIAHNLGIIHRDLKPANLMLCQDSAGREQVKVLDFGTARLSAAEEQEAVNITRQGQIFGTPLYMSPEQVTGDPTESTADIYSLGVILYQMLTGTVPFLSEKSFQTMMAHVHQSPEPPSKRNPSLPNGFDELVLKALEKNPAQRYQTATALIERLAATVRAISGPTINSGSTGALKLPDQRTLSSMSSNISNVPTGSDTLSRSSGNSDVRLSRVRMAALQEPDFDQYVGREAELKRLQNEYFTASEGRAHPTFVVGTAGIGKTQLLSRFREWANNQGAMVLLGKFYDYGGSIAEPLRLFKNLLINAIPSLSNSNTSSGTTTDDQFRKLFGSDTNNGESLEGEKWQVFDRLTAAFTMLSKESPVVLLVDDLQWADVLSLEFLGYLLRNTENLPICFIGSARSEEADTKGNPFREWLIAQSRYLHYEKIELVPFDNKMINYLLQAIFQFIEVSHKDIDTLFQLTNGNPFYLGEVIRMLLEGQKIAFQYGLWRGTGFDEVKLPDSISNVVRYKLENCSEDVRHLLTQASVIGDNFSFELLQEVSEVDEKDLEKLLAQGVKQLLLGEDGKSAGDHYRFALTTIRRVIYDDIPKRQRRRLHLKVAAAIVKVNKNRLRGLDGILAYHFHSAGDWEEALKYAHTALTAAQHQQAMDEVVRYSRYAEESIENLSENDTPPADYNRQLGELRLNRATALMRLGRFADAEKEASTMREFIEASGDVYLQARRYLILTELCYWGNRHVEGLEVGKVGLELARKASDEECERYILFYYSWCQARTTKLELTLPIFKEIIEMSAKAGDKSLQARSLCAFGQLTHFTGKWRKARAALEEAYKLARASSDRFVECQSLVMWPWALEYEGKSDQLHKIVDEGIKVARSCGWRNWEAYLYFLSGRNHARRALTDLTQGEELLSRSMAIMQETGDTSGQLILSPELAMLAMRVTPSPEAVEKLRTVTTILSKHCETLVNCETLCALGAAEQQLDSWQQSLATFRRALEMAEMIPYADCQWRAHFGIAQCLLKDGDEAASLEHLSRAIEVINQQKQEFDNPLEIADYLEDKQHVYAAYADFLSSND